MLLIPEASEASEAIPGITFSILLVCGYLKNASDASEASEN